MLVNILLVIIIGLILAQFRYARSQRKRVEQMLANKKKEASSFLSGSTAHHLSDLAATVIPEFQKHNIRLFKNTLPERIGHLALETDLWLKELILQGDEGGHYGLIMSREKAANPHLLRYLEKHFDFNIPQTQWDSLVQYLPEFESLMSIRHDYGVAYLETASLYRIYTEWGERPSLFKLTDEDKEFGWSTLRRWGLKEGDWFVCFHNREEGYAPHDDKYHTYRNAPIDSLFPAMKEVVARGGWVIRVGDPSMTPLPKMERVIDYVHTPEKGARMDVFLCGACRFFFGNTSGIFIVSTIFGVPVAGANFAPISALQYTHRDVGMPKLLYSEKEKRLLTFQESLDSDMANLRYTVHFEEGGTRLVDNTEDELLELTIEMLERAEGTCVYSEEDERLHAAFMSLFKPGHYGYGSAARTSRYFLKKHRALLPPLAS
jgi:putative glycosyltransferase (TIGR04372 family)